MRIGSLGLILALTALLSGFALNANALLRSGPYTVWVVEGGLDDGPGWVEINRHGMHLRTIRDRIISEARILPLSGTGAADLFVKTFSGGAHSSTTVYILGLREKLCTLLVFNADNYDIKAFKDLDHDGRQEMIAWDDSFAYYDTSFAASPALPFVFHYERGRFRDATSRYPALLNAERAKAEKQLIAAIGRKPHRPAQSPDANDTYQNQEAWRQEDIRSAIIAAYGDALVSGTARRTQVWLRAHLPASDWKWFLRARKDIELTVADRGRKIAYNLHPKWRPPYWRRVRSGKG